MKRKDIKEYFSPACNCIDKPTLRMLSEICFCLGLASVIGSVVTWFTASKENRAYGERFGIFIGLWVPSFLILANLLSRKADALPEPAEEE